MKTTMKKSTLPYWLLVWGKAYEITHTEYHADGINITITYKPKKI